jgi:RNase HII (EC 3.1.26.4)
MYVVIGGIDEAGRGPVVGPMVIAVVVGDGEALRRLGVRDSKRLSPAARRRLFAEVLKAADCVNYVVVEPHVVDLYVQRGGLNALELDFTARLVGTCPADLYYVDSPDVKPERYGAALSFLTGRRFVALHRGEEVPQVAAASIVAKVVRDRLMELVAQETGGIGTGYPSDPKTVEALRTGRIPAECVRWRWRTVRG